MANGQTNLYVGCTRRRRLLINLQNDLLSWLLDEAKGEELTNYNLVLRILTLEFASIHTTTNVS